MKKLLLLAFTTFIHSAYTQPNPYFIREEITRSIEALDVAPESIHKIVNQEISGGDFSVPVRVYYPSDEEDLPILYHIHGGAWIAGNLDTHDNICRHLANETNAVVVAVHYRRPPEHLYPTALDDCYFILRWIDRHQAELKGNGELYLIGDSAGGGLVPAVCLKNLAADSTIAIQGQVLINPAPDFRDGSSTYGQYSMFIDWYVPPETDRNDPLLSPLVSDRFPELPKSLVVVSENDAIGPDGIQFHEQMIRSGNSSRLLELKGVGHLAGNWAARSDQARDAVEFVVQGLKEWVAE